jgi:hypothetical protein
MIFAAFNVSFVHVVSAPYAKLSNEYKLHNFKFFSHTLFELSTASYYNSGHAASRDSAWKVDPAIGIDRWNLDVYSSVVVSDPSA